ncbi:hypothetical protein, partial [Aeromonas hydrophila]|uniref:hypothetical protein n=1 Tax=Aeromonas hydrophila TaxID=644 RepID=UPI002B48D89B
LQMTNMISYQGLVRTFPREAGRFMLHEPNLYLSRPKIGYVLIQSSSFPQALFNRFITNL